MPLKPLRRNYNCSDADLKKTADKIANCATRDMSDFAEYNITTTDITAFKAIIVTFEDRVTDDESLGEQQIETDAKNALRKQLEDLLRQIRVAAQLKYGHQGKYRKFGFNGFSTLTDNDFIRMVKRVGRVLEELKTEMTPSFPSIQAKLLALTTKGDAFDNAVNAILDKKNARDIVTQDRILAGNAVYTELSRLSAIGKALYQDINEAKYNDYVLGFQGGTPKKPIAPGVGWFEGNVSDVGTGAGIAGAVISIQGESYTTTSDEYGDYLLEIPLAGSYIPVIKAEGYGDKIMGSYNIAPGKKTRVQLAALTRNPSI